MIKSVPKITFLRVRKIIVYIVVFSLTFSVGYGLGVKGIGLPETSIRVKVDRTLPANKELDFSLFWQIWDTLEASYFDKSRVDKAAMVYGAIKGMVASLGDPYTSFLTPDENRVVEEDLGGEFEGVGIQIGFRGTQLAVIAPLPGSPAQKAGIKAGDYIIGIKDEAKGIDKSTIGISLPEAVQDIRGAAGTTVTLALLRNGEADPIIVDVKREAIEVPSVVLDFIGDGSKIAHLKIIKFGGETVAEWDKAVLEILKNPTRNGLIIDLRNNTGGYLQAAVDISSDFIDTGEVIVVEEKAGGEKYEFTSERIPRLENENVVILVNKGSASASEILAGALRDQKEFILVGQTTFGKGTIQEPRNIEGGGSLHITTAKWLTPKGIWVNETGLAPDVIIEDDPDQEGDEELEKALSLLTDEV